MPPVLSTLASRSRAIAVLIGPAAGPVSSRFAVIRMYAAVPESFAAKGAARITLLQGPADEVAKAEVWQIGHNGVFSREYKAGEEPQWSWVRARRVPAEAFSATTAYLLPYGYPKTVAPSYTAYASWAFFGMLFSSISGVLSTQSLLYAVGVGAGSVPLAAALNWVLKDGLGQLGGVLSAALINNRFDTDPKRWRFISGLAQDGSTLLEILTPLLPAAFLPLAAAANVGKNISWLAASATRAGIHNSLAVKGNLADVTAKAGSQTITGSTIGMLLGIVLSPAVGSDPRHILLAFAACSVLHLTCVFQSLRRVVLPTLSARRLAYATAPFFTLLEHDGRVVEGPAAAEGPSEARGAGVASTGAGSGLELCSLRPPTEPHLAAASAAAGGLTSEASAAEPAPPHRGAPSHAHPPPAAPAAATPAEAAAHEGLLASARTRVLTPQEVGQVEDFAVKPLSKLLGLAQRASAASIAAVRGLRRRGSSSEAEAVHLTDSQTPSSSAARSHSSGASPALQRLRDTPSALPLDAAAAALVDIGPSLRCGWGPALLEFAAASDSGESKYVVAVWRGAPAAASAASSGGPRSAARPRAARVQLLYAHDASWRDCILGFLHAHYVARHLLATGAVAVCAEERATGGAAAAAPGAFAPAGAAPSADLAAVRQGAVFVQGFGDRLLQDLELVGWWVGQPLLERDFNKRLFFGASAEAGDGLSLSAAASGSGIKGAHAL